ncbi:hypothetical protein [Peribacillus simplex]|uniref:hypothetical protein n=1 Tax=Peribacillus simplex TaxID=1478 RepID=UPI0024C1EF6D|nr:hypothetical protein [Peribacillus simplex]WHY57552.1 hypothetical protein QNH43_04465 [Peribacillus simplex]
MSIWKANDLLTNFIETKIAPDGTPYSINKSNKTEHPIAMDVRGSRNMTLLLVPRNLTMNIYPD